MFTSSPNASMHCQRCPFYDIHPGECAAFRYCRQCGQGRLGRLLCPYLYGNVTLIDFCVGRHTSRPRWSGGFHCQMFCEDACIWEASSFEEGSSKGTPSTGLVHACIWGKGHTVYVLLGSGLSGRDLEPGFQGWAWGLKTICLLCLYSSVTLAG